MTEDTFADFIRLADRWYHDGDVRGEDFHREHERLQAQLAALPLELRRVLVCSLIMANLKELVTGPHLFVVGEEESAPF